MSREESDEGEEFEFDSSKEEEEKEEFEEYEKSAELTEEQKEKQKASRIEQKKLLLERKLQKPNFDIIIKAKEIWEILRQKRLSKSDRRDHMKEMMNIVRGKALDIIYKHDASRIVQCCIKYGSPDERDEVAAELDGHYASLSQSKYGRFIVTKILQYCSQKYRNAVIKDFYGKVRKMIRHKEASLVLDEAYSQYANAAQRNSLMEEFYGPEFAIFKNDDGSRGSLQDLIHNHPLKKQYVLKYTRAAIDSVLEKSSFNVGKTPILHRAIIDYLTVADSSACKDMIELLKDHLVHMLHTREGARVAQYCILHATPKDRKQIVKGFKGFVHSIAKEQYGHAVLISCFECIDDTVLVGKTLIGEIFTPTAPDASVSELLRDQYGSRVVLYLLCGRNKRYQPSYIIKELKETDSVRAETTKKDSEVRHKQLLEVVSPLLVPEVARFTEELIRDRAGSLVLLETCNQAIGDVSKVICAVLETLKRASLTDYEAKQEGEIVHVVKKMKAERDAQKKKDQGVDLEESVLVGRSSLLTIKLLLANSKDTDPAWKAEFRRESWKIIEPRFVELVKQSVANPFTSSGLSFVFVALFEAGDSTIQTSMKSKLGKTVNSLKAALEKSVSENGEIESKKRKQDTFKGGISILLGHLV